MTNSIAFKTGEPGRHLHHPGQHERHGRAGQRLGPARRAPAGGGDPGGRTTKLGHAAAEHADQRRRTRPRSGYNPFAANAPVTIYATGVRNAYDLIWHSNGELYTRDQRFGRGRQHARPRPATLPSACTPPHRRHAVHRPAGAGHHRQPDRRGRLPLPDRPGRLLRPPQPLALRVGAERRQPDQRHRRHARSTAYPVGTQPDRNWRGAAVFNFGAHYSPNGMIEWKAPSVPSLMGKLLIIRYSGRRRHHRPDHRPQHQERSPIRRPASPASVASSSRSISPTTRPTATSTSPNTPRRTRPAASTCFAPTRSSPRLQPQLHEGGGGWTQRPVLRRRFYGGGGGLAAEAQEAPAGEQGLGGGGEQVEVGEVQIAWRAGGAGTRAGRSAPGGGGPGRRPASAAGRPRRGPRGRCCPSGGRPRGQRRSAGRSAGRSSVGSLHLASSACTAGRSAAVAAAMVMGWGGRTRWAMPSRVSRARTRAWMSSRMARTTSGGLPLGSSSGQSSRRRPGTTGQASPQPMVTSRLRLAGQLVGQLAGHGCPTGRRRPPASPPAPRGGRGCRARCRRRWPGRRPGRPAG